MLQGYLRSLLTVLVEIVSTFWTLVLHLKFDVFKLCSPDIVLTHKVKPYLYLQMLLGPLGDKYGARKTFGVCLLLSGVAMVRHFLYEVQFHTEFVISWI